MTSIIQTISKEKLEKIVKTSNTLMEVLNRLGLSGRGHSYDYIKERLKNEKIPYNHFIKIKFNKYNSINDILIENSTYQSSSKLKTKLIDNNLKKDICESCGQLPTHNNKFLSLQLDHINGNKKDNRIENLRILCPNCHSQTHTFSGKNKKINGDMFCKCCNKKIGFTKFGMCKKCFIDSEEGKNYRKNIAKNQKTKFEVSKEELEKLVSEYPIVQIGKKYNVSDNAIRKRCKKFNIDFRK